MAAWLKWKTWKSLGAWISCLNFLLSLANIYIFFFNSCFHAKLRFRCPAEPLVTSEAAPQCAEHLWHSTRGTASLSWGKSCFPSSFSWGKNSFHTQLLVQEQRWHLQRKQNPVGRINSSLSTCKWLLFMMRIYSFGVCLVFKIFGDFLAGALEGNTFH